nr:TROVE domain-containing protein [Armatimonadota bacterium]
MAKYLNAVKTRPSAMQVTPQSQPIPGRKQVRNTAGGYTFAVDNWTRLHRWLILGSEGGTYYASERTLTAENANIVLECLAESGPRVVELIVEISGSGRAPKNDPALLALALASSYGHLETRHAALVALPRVARTGTHLFHFAAYCDGQRGWGKGLQKAVARWYNDRPAKELAYGAIKYQQRDGWSHRDLLRKAHLKPASESHNIIYGWIASEGWESVGPEPHPDENVRQLWAFERVKRAESAEEVARLVADYRLPREAVPTQWLQSPAVWEALLREMPMTALIRNLATLTRIGLIAPLSETLQQVVGQLGDVERIRKARVHPIAILAALKTYQQGRGERGSHQWTPVSQIVDALDGAFYSAFGNVKSSEKRWLLGVDCSGSMDGGLIAGVPGLTPRMAAAAMSMVTAAVESQNTIVGFTAGDSRGNPGIRSLNVSPRQRMDTVMNVMQKFNWGATDCSLPMRWAMKEQVPVDVFTIYTDNETWFGKIHPVQA